MGYIWPFTSSLYIFVESFFNYFNIQIIDNEKNIRFLVIAVSCCLSVF